MKKCPKCNAKLQKGRRRCPGCGEFVAKRKSQRGGLLDKIRGAKPSTLVWGGAGLLLAVIAIVILFSVIGNGKNHTLYVKGSEMSFIEAASEKPVKLTEKLVYENSMDQFDLEYMSNHYYSKLIKKTKSGDRIYYPSSIIRLSNYTLTYRDLDEKDGEIVEVAKGVSDYKISEDGEMVVYVSEGTLYLYNGKEARALAKGVTQFDISKDGKKIIYVDSERAVCLEQSGKTKKIVKTIASLDYISEDFSEIYYTKDATLYRKELGKDAKKMASKVVSVLKIYESGEVYYLKENATKILAKDYVDFDVKEEKEDIKKDLEKNEIDTHTYELFYYDGKSAKSVAKNVQQENLKMAEERPVVVYKSCDLSGMEKVKLSEIDSVWAVEENIVNYVEQSSAYSVAVGKNARTIKEKNVENVILAEDGNTVYYVADVAEDKVGAYDATGKLYKMSVSGSKAGAGKKYATDVFAKNIDFVGAEGVLYYKNVSEVEYTMQGELYVNKKLADENVKLGSAVCYGDVDDKTVYFFTDWKYQASMGTLKKVKGSKVTELRKAAHAFYSMKKGELLFIGDYDVETYAGNLYRHVRGKAHKIDKDVIAIMQNK